MAIPVREIDHMTAHILVYPQMERYLGMRPGTLAAACKDCPQPQPAAPPNHPPPPKGGAHAPR